ncbi:hypothetical protein A3L04_09595 [Thermococcus chitonophagus]|uniref:FIG001454: Transglutaminase-like enzymes, putative cysteine proteases n=1 Tax=Thermococcus chitonophagus TaxID=54262 RepID=A0A160VSQ7_9EURY|nr:transglutaminase domain-containing protein [Thermococcus chitonophagus]ASJ17303.1 hypothetical protein A3L04_09595 [Thermococcus chitonophagus]CUX77932.1 FIG001454: Transglutaminase-like enzymes, putative cysteine proteases [Thermococcus chitonophagus]
MKGVKEVLSALIIGIAGLLILSASIPQGLVPNLAQNIQENEHDIDLRENAIRSALLNNTPVMVVYEERGIVEYLRQNVYYRYENGRWTGEQQFKGVSVFGYVPIFKPTNPHKTLTDKITVEMRSPLISGNIYTALYTARLSIPAIYSEEYIIFRPSRYPVQSYEFEVEKYEFPPNILKNASVPEIKKYLQTPKLSTRVYELAKNITRGISSPYEKALAIERFLKQNYIYDETAPPAPPGIDPVEWFLFYSKRGVCLDFNTAFVILARINGLPARLVTGFRVEPKPGKQEVLLKQAHAWAEVYFNGLGWVTFDATGSPRQSKGKKEQQRPREETIPEVRIPLGESRTVALQVKSKNISVNSPLPVTLHRHGDQVILNITGTKVGKFKLVIVADTKNITVPVIVGYKTIVRITEWPHEVRTGANFTVKGIVTTLSGAPVPVGSVRIELRKDKRTPGKIIGRGRVVNGKFNVTCSAAGVAGKYQLVAIYEGGEVYFPSVSDPEIVIKDKAKIYVNKFNYTKVGPIKIEGFLGTEGGAFLSEEPIEIILDGKLLGVARTDKNGKFSFSFVLTSPGLHNLTILYSGQEGVEGDSETITFRAIEASISIPALADAGDYLKITGQIEGIKSGRLKITGDFGEYSVSINNEGHFKVEIPVPRNFEGYKRVAVYYEDLLLAEKYVYVRQKIIVEASGTIMVAKKPNDLIIRVRYTNGTPVSRARIVLTAFNSTFVNFTDEMGISKFVLTPPSPGTYPLDVMVITSNGFEVTPIKVRVYKYPIYVYIALAALIVSLGAFSIRALLTHEVLKIFTTRDPPIYVNREEISVTSNVPISLYVDGKFYAKGKEFTLKLSPGNHEIWGKFLLFRSKPLRIKVCKNREEAIIEAFEKCADGEPSKTAREILGVNKIVLIFEKVRYGLKSASVKEFLEFIKSACRRDI